LNSLVNLGAIQAPVAGMAFTRELAKFLDAALGIIPAGHALQVIADELIEAFAQRFCPAPPPFCARARRTGRRGTA
jgi:hypothetical protein